MASDLLDNMPFYCLSLDFLKGTPTLAKIICVWNTLHKILWLCASTLGGPLVE